MPLPERWHSKTKTSIIILLAGLLATAPALSQTLSPDAKAALDSALQDERHAEAFYSAVMAKFGEVRPFSNIINAERQHEAIMIDLYQTYDIAAPENGYATAALEAPATLIDACKIGVEAEIANRDLYDVNLLPAVSAYPDITLVLQRLRDASEDKHLPAFQRCVNQG